MRKTRILGSLPALFAAATLLLVLPSALCQQGDSCAMRGNIRQAESAAPCVPGPTFDCCRGDQAPPSGSEQPVAKRLIGPSELPVALAVAPAQSAVAGLPRTANPGGPGLEIPLYTLLAALLI